MDYEPDDCLPHDYVDAINRGIMAFTKKGQARRKLDGSKCAFVLPSFQARRQRTRG